MFSGVPVPHKQLATVLCMMLACVCMQPLGSPVVPLVYGRIARSVGAAVCGGGSPVAASASIQAITAPPLKPGNAWCVVSQGTHAAGGAFSPCTWASKASVKCVTIRCD